jgi:hypothetical protein
LVWYIRAPTWLEGQIKLYWCSEKWIVTNKSVSGLNYILLCSAMFNRIFFRIHAVIFY